MSGLSYTARYSCSKSYPKMYASILSTSVHVTEAFSNASDAKVACLPTVYSASEDPISPGIVHNIYFSTAHPLPQISALRKRTSVGIIVDSNSLLLEQLFPSHPCLSFSPFCLARFAPLRLVFRSEAACKKPCQPA